MDISLKAGLLGMGGEAILFLDQRGTVTMPLSSTADELGSEFRCESVTT
jgi:hypothetical protein